MSTTYDYDPLLFFSVVGIALGMMIVFGILVWKFLTWMRKHGGEIAAELRALRQQLREYATSPVRGMTVCHFPKWDGDPPDHLLKPGMIWFNERRRCVRYSYYTTDAMKPLVANWRD